MGEVHDTVAARQNQDRWDLAEVLRTVEGRRFIRRLLTEARLYEFSPQGLNDREMLYGAAQRDFGLLIVAMVNDVDPRAFVTLTREAAEDAASLNTKTSGDPND